VTPPTRSAGALQTLVMLLSGCSMTSDRSTSAAAGSAVPAPPGAPTEALAGLALGAGVHSLRVQSQAAVVVVPEQSNGGLIMYLHGYGADASAIVRDGGFGRLATGLVEQGYTVAASDAFGDAWGNTASVEAHAALAATVRSLVPTEDVYLVAESMGGLAGARLVDSGHIAGLRAYAAIFPLCDLASVYPGFRRSIDAAHGARVDSALDELSPVALSGAVPLRIWASPDDTTVAKDRNADVCAAEAAADGGVVTVVETEGDHGDPSNFDLPALLAFFGSAAG
jgi:alpha-beta hydrolase superfamily lysophospholipase